MRRKLLAMMGTLMGLMGLVVCLASPLSPVVEPVRDIEEIWAIEDSRQRSDAPLVTSLQNDGQPLGYDAQTRTFYCPLGLEQGETWPQLRLTAPQAQGVSLCFSDDYTYDWCSDAISEGYAYEVMAYTDTHYDYFDIVFTGLPVVVIDAETAVGRAETHAQVSVSQYGLTAAIGDALVHERGAGSAAVSEKKSYRVEFSRVLDGKDVLVDVPRLGVTEEFLLLSCTTDKTLIRDRLSWQMVAHLADEKESFGARQAEYVEVFENGEYMGVYLMMKPVDIEEELRKSGEYLTITDSVYRSTSLEYPGERLCIENTARESSGYELFYEPTADAAFSALEAYIDLELEEDDKLFAEKAERLIDAESLLRQYLLVQACGMSDNVYNNMYIWAHQTKDGLVYRFAPWDMDLTWGRYKVDGAAYHGLFTFGVAQRMIDLDVGGTTRSTLSAMWLEMREGAFNVETIERYVQESEAQLMLSGAFLRNSERWGLEIWEPEGYEIVDFASEHLNLLDEAFAAYAP